MFLNVSIFCYGAEIGQSEEKPFYMGVYLYEGLLVGPAQSDGLDYFVFLDKHLKILKENGVNLAYYAQCDPAKFDKVLSVFQKNGIKVIPQLDFVLFCPSYSEEQMFGQAKVAGEFIKRYQNHPSIYGWSVGEEVTHENVNKMARYYSMIMEYVPDVKMVMIHNSLGAAKDWPLPDPFVIGTDRYAFWWELSGGGYLASPASALEWTRSEAEKYYKEAAKRGADFMFVVTQGGMLMPSYANAIIKKPETAIYPTTPKEQKEMQAKVLKYAQENRMGWRKFSTSKGEGYTVWKYYRTPENCLRASAWIGVMEGARLLFVWHYNPAAQNSSSAELQDVAMMDNPPFEQYYWTLAGRPGMKNPQLKEYAEVAKEIKVYQRIITQMSKIPESPVEMVQKNTFCRAFTFPNMKGKIIVLQNSNVGTWPGESRYIFKESDPIFINDEGSLVGFVPFRKPMDISFVVKQSDSNNKVFDIKTGKEISGKEGHYAIPIYPGSGTLIYLGTPEEAAMLHRLITSDR
jgi:hypothetical protein